MATAPVGTKPIGYPEDPDRAPKFNESMGIYTGFLADWRGAHSDHYLLGRLGYKPEAAVIHTMAGYLTGTRQWFNTGRIERGINGGISSAHFGVGRNGACDQYVKFGDTAYHAGSVHNPSWVLIGQRPAISPNLYTIGIENEDMNMVGNQAQPWTHIQRHCNAWIIAVTAARYGWVPMPGLTVVRHSEIDKINRAQCPGQGAPTMADLTSLAKRYMLHL